MSKVNSIIVQFQDGDISLQEAGELLMEIGFSPRFTREFLQPFYAMYMIPKGYFGKEL